LLTEIVCNGTFA